MPENADTDQKKRKEEMTAQAREKQKKPLQQEHEIDIHIKYSPLKIIKGSIFVLLLIVAFVLGRITVDTSASPQDQQKESGFSAFFHNLFSAKSSGLEVQVPKVDNVTAKVNSTVEPTVKNASANTTSAITNTTTQQPSNGTIITKYSKVVISLNDVTVDWKGTWGKITEIDYSIKNNEDGIIKPDHFVMTMEGYTDFEKKIPVSSAIAAEKSDAAVVIVPGGFAYNQATAGDLTNVEITLVLYDAQNAAMASFKQEFNLKRG